MKKTIQSIQTLEECEAYLQEHIKTYLDFPKPGVAFKDIQSILIDPELVCVTTMYLTQLLPCDKNGNLLFDKILCFDARGFLFGCHMAIISGVPLIMARKPDKLPGELISENFEKEYDAAGGKKFETIQIQKGLINSGDRILIHDDLLATGGTASAAANIVNKCGGIVTGFHFIIDLEYLPGRKVLQKYVSDDLILSLVKFK